MRTYMCCYNGKWREIMASSSAAAQDAAAEYFGPKAKRKPWTIIVVLADAPVDTTAI